MTLSELWSLNPMASVHVAHKNKQTSSISVKKILYQYSIRKIRKLDFLRFYGLDFFFSFLDKFQFRSKLFRDRDRNKKNPSLCSICSNFFGSLFENISGEFVLRRMI